MVYIMNNKLKHLPIGILTLTTVVSGVALSAPGAFAESSANATVTVGDACTFAITSNTTTLSSIVPGSVVNTEGDTSRNGIFDTTCNNPNGFKIQAIGYTNSTEGSTVMSSSTTGLSIATGLNTTGNTSSWAFKVTNATGSAGVAIDSDYASRGASDDLYRVIPSTADDLVTYTGSSSAVVTGTLRTDYRVYVSASQAAGTYTGAVRYTIVTL